MIESLYKRVPNILYENEFSNLIHDTFSEKETNIILQYYNFKKGNNCLFYQSNGFNPSEEYGLSIHIVKFEDEWFGLFTIDYKFHKSEIDTVDDYNRYKYFKCDTFDGLLQALDKIKKDQNSILYEKLESLLN